MANLTIPGSAALGSLQITGGSPVAGDILQIDGSGNVSFVTPSAALAAAGIASGSLAMGNAVTSGAVSGLTLTFTPSRAIVTVRKPSGGRTLFASVVAGTISAAGFSFDLSAATDATTYLLDWILLA